MHKGMAVSAAIGAVFAVGATSVGAASAGPRLVPDPDSFVVEVVKVDGSGCSKGNVFATVADDRKAFGVIYGNYTARAGGSSAPADGHKNCSVAVKVHLAPDITYAVSSTDHRGYASLSSGATASLTSGYSFQGQSDGTLMRHNLKGAHNDNYTFTDKPHGDRLVYRPCGEDPTFNFTTDLRVGKGTDSSKANFITLGMVDKSFITTYNLSFKRCK